MTKSSLLWSEKHRPSTIESLSLPPHLIEFYNTAISSNSFPNLLLHGPPGTGKTTFANILGRHICGGKAIVKEMNASDERGIAVIRNEIKELSMTIVPKVIILDECENLTKDSQACLRRILEDYTETTRFIFCTNYLSKIIQPLKSRLLKFRFEVQDISKDVLQQIVEREDCQSLFSASVLNHVFRGAEKDLRRAINVIQGVYPLLSFAELDENEIIKLIDNVTGVIDENTLNVFKNLTMGNYQQFIEGFLRSSYSVLQLVMQLLKLEEAENIDMMIVLGECEYKLMQGCSRRTVLTYLCIRKIQFMTQWI